MKAARKFTLLVIVSLCIFACSTPEEDRYPQLPEAESREFLALATPNSSGLPLMTMLKLADDSGYEIEPTFVLRFDKDEYPSRLVALLPSEHANGDMIAAGIILNKSRQTGQPFLLKQQEGGTLFVLAPSGGFLVNSQGIESITWEGSLEQLGLSSESYRDNSLRLSNYQVPCAIEDSIDLECLRSHVLDSRAMKCLDSRWELLKKSEIKECLLPVVEAMAECSQPHVNNFCDDEEPCNGVEICHRSLQYGRGVCVSAPPIRELVPEDECVEQGSLRSIQGRVNSSHGQSFVKRTWRFVTEDLGLRPHENAETHFSQPFNLATTDFESADGQIVVTMKYFINRNNPDEDRALLLTEATNGFIIFDKDGGLGVLTDKNLRVVYLSAGEIPSSVEQLKNFQIPDASTTADNATTTLLSFTSVSHPLVAGDFCTVSDRLGMACDESIEWECYKDKFLDSLWINILDSMPGLSLFGYNTCDELKAKFINLTLDGIPGSLELLLNSSTLVEHSLVFKRIIWDIARGVDNATLLAKYHEDLVNFANDLLEELIKLGIVKSPTIQFVKEVLDVSSWMFAIKDCAHDITEQIIPALSACKSGDEFCEDDTQGNGVEICDPDEKICMIKCSKWIDSNETICAHNQYLPPDIDSDSIPDLCDECPNKRGEKSSCGLCAPEEACACFFPGCERGNWRCVKPGQFSTNDPRRVQECIDMMPTFQPYASEVIEATRSDSCNQWESGFDTCPENYVCNVEECGGLHGCSREQLCISICDNCSVGTVVCNDDGTFSQCESVGNACTVWSEPEFCGQGTCVPCDDRNCDPCLTSECLYIGERECVDEYRYRECVNSGASVLSWSEDQSCLDGMFCESSTGECSSNCFDECAEGNRECVTIHSYQECIFIGDCGTKWSTPQACSEGSMCDLGTCVPDSTYNEQCPLGIIQCGPSNTIEECKDFVTGSDWVTIEECDETEICSNGACSPCGFECQEGTVRCSGQDIEECQQSSCGTHWSVIDSCATGEVCLENGSFNYSCEYLGEPCSDGDPPRCNSTGDVEICALFNGSYVWRFSINCGNRKCVDGDCVNGGNCHPDGYQFPVPSPLGCTPYIQNQCCSQTCSYYSPMTYCGNPFCVERSTLTVCQSDADCCSPSGCGWCNMLCNRSLGLCRFGSGHNCSFDESCLSGNCLSSSCGP